MFERYIFEHPGDDGRSIAVSGWGYVAAGLAGSPYVLWKAGLAGFVPALASHLLLLGLVVGATGVTSFALSGIQQMTALAVAIPMILTAQSLVMIEIIKKTYRRRGWIVDTSV